MEEPSQIPVMTAEQAESRHYLSGKLLETMHLEPQKPPVAQVLLANGTVEYYYDPRHVREAPPEDWYQRPPEPVIDPLELDAHCLLITNGCPRCTRSAVFRVQVFRVQRTVGLQKDVQEVGHA